MDNLMEVGRADLLLPFRHEDQVHRQLTVRALKGVQRREPHRFRSFLVDRAAADQDLSDSGPVDQTRLKRR